MVLLITSFKYRYNKCAHSFWMILWYFSIYSKFDLSSAVLYYGFSGGGKFTLYYSFLPLRTPNFPVLLEIYR